MDDNKSLSSRINLFVSPETSILIEKESDKRGIHRTQFIKEAIHEKLNSLTKYNYENTQTQLKEELREIKHLLVSTLEKLSNEKMNSLM